MADMSEVPQDRGWAWVVLFGAFVVNMVIVGGFKTMGVLFVEFLDLYQASRSMTALTLGIMGLGLSIMAPVGNALGKRFTYRQVIMTGGVLVAVSSFLTAFGKDVVYLIIVYGILTGVGYGLSFSATIVVVSEYFEKKRSLANGIAVAGGSIGQLVFPPILRLVIEKYSIRGAMFILAGFGLQIVCSGSLFRPFSYYQRKKSDDLVYQDLDSGVGVVEAQIKLVPENNISDLSNESNPSSFEGDKQNNICDKDTQGEIEMLLSYGSENHELMSEGQCDRASVTSDISEMSAKCTTLMSSTGSVCIVPKKRRKKHKVTFLAQKENKVDENDDIAFTNNDRQKGFFNCCNQENGAPKIGPIFEFSLFHKPLFVIYIISIVLGNIGFLNPLLFVPSYAKDLGEPPQTQALLVSIMGATDFVGRILGGWFGNLGLVERYKIMAVSHMITGTTLIVTQFAPSLASLIVISAVEGLIGGTALSQMAVILVDFLGIENLSSSHGLTMMMIGLGQIGMPSFIGFLRETTGTYQVAFAICGVFMITAAIVLLLAPIARRLQEKWELKDVNDLCQE